MKTRTSKEYHNIDLRTLNQWKKERKVPINAEEGIVLWSNQFCAKIYVYYSPDQVRDMTDTELQAYTDELQEKKEKLRLKKREQRAREREEHQEKIAKQKLLDEYNKKLQEFLILPSIYCKNESKMIVVDIETTGLNFWDDEICKISILDGFGNVLLNSYIKPVLHQEWLSAQHINHISPQMVANAPHLYELIPVIRGIFEGADKLVFYNADFDLSFIAHHTGIAVAEHQRIIDVMVDFAEIYGEFNDHYQDYTWQKLTTCAEYYGYTEYNAHDSLEDCKATLFCYNKMQE